MSFELIDIDHIIIRVAGLEAGAELYQSFGFTVAPPRENVGAKTLRTDHDAGSAQPDAPAPFNSRLILFQPYPGRDDVANMIELMCIERQFGAPELAPVMSFLLDTAGPKTICCATADFAKTVQAMDAAGVVNFVPQMFESRTIDVERDRVISTRVRPVIPGPRQTPFTVNAYETSTLASYRYEPWTVHPNSARYMAGVTGVTDDLEAHVDWMASRVFGVKPRWESENIAVIRPRDIFLRVVNPAGFAELYPALDFSDEQILPVLCGVTVVAGSLARVREQLEANSVEHVVTPASVLVPRRHAANTIVEFVTAEPEIVGNG